MRDKTGRRSVSGGSLTTRLTNLWLDFAQSLWFVPTLFLIGGGVAEVVLVTLERELLPPPPEFLRTSETTARATLAAISGAMFTVVGVVFSTTVVALSITVGNLGPRLLRTFLRQLVTQVTMGICLATAVYSLLLLRHVDPVGGEIFVPQWAVLLADVLAVGTLVAIVYFVHRVGQAIQAQNVVIDVADELDDAVERLCPEGDRGEVDEAEGRDYLDRYFDDDAAAETLTVGGPDGYLQAVDVDRLVELARRTGTRMKTLVRTGDFIAAGDAAVEFVCDERENPGADEDRDATLDGVFLRGPQRTPQQDLGSVVRELTEVAVRALSPGVNDPRTALMCLDRLRAAFGRLATRPGRPSLFADEEGELRLYVAVPPFAELIEDGFGPIRRYAAGDVDVIVRFLETVAAIRNRCPEDRRHALQRQGEAMLVAAGEEVAVEADRERVRRIGATLGFAGEG